MIVLEYLKGGQLMDHLHTIGNKYSEQDASALFAQVPVTHVTLSVPARLLRLARRAQCEGDSPLGTGYRGCEK